jgi:hypothetical protein
MFSIPDYEGCAAFDNTLAMPGEWYRTNMRHLANSKKYKEVMDKWNA